MELPPKGLRPGISGKPPKFARLPNLAAQVAARRSQPGAISATTGIGSPVSGSTSGAASAAASSGIGRESGSYGLDEYTEIKSVHIQLGKRAKWLAE